MGLDSVEIVIEAERLFNIELSDEEVTKINTFGAFVECVYEASLKLGRSIEKAEVHATLRTMVSEHLAVSEENIKPESRFVEDLGMN